MRKKLLELFGLGVKQKTTGKEVIDSVTPNVPVTKSDKVKRDLKLDVQKLKGGKAKLDQTIFEVRHKQPITFKKNKEKTLSNTEKTKLRNDESKKAFKASEGKTKVFYPPKNFNKGGRVGLKFGSKKSNVQKIQETFGPKKKLSPKQMKIAKLAGNPKKIDAADFAKLRRS